MIKRLIFDVITGVNFVESVRQTLKKLDVYSEENVQLFLKGISTYEQQHDKYDVAVYTEHMGKAMNTTLPNIFVPVFFEELKSVIPPRNELLIDKIHSLSQEYELALLTNYFSESQINRLNAMGIGQYFKECHGEKCIKPNKSAYISACGNRNPNECVMIGDDIYLDIERAQQEGLNTIFVNTKGIQTNAKTGIVVNSVLEISKEMINKIDEK